LAMLHIAVQRMKKPQRRIGRVVKPFILPFREHVRDQPFVHVMSKGAQNPACLDRSPGRQSEPFERDHRVPAPIGEPVIAGDHGAHFIALGTRSGPVGNASYRGNHEGVGGEGEFGCKSGPCRCCRHPNQAPAAFAFEIQRIAGLNASTVCQASVAAIRVSGQSLRISPAK
jgi:hypothetical protein